MKTINKGTGFYPWRNREVNYSDFFYDKKTNFDFDEYFFTTPNIASCNLTAEITKNKGEKVTEEDLNSAFANSLFIEMTDLDFNEKNAENFFTALPLEFYTKQTYDLICKKMEHFEEENAFDKTRLKQNLRLFQEFAHKVNQEEIPEPQKNSSDLSKV